MRRERDTVEWAEASHSVTTDEPFTTNEDLKNDLNQAIAQLSSDEQVSIHLCYAEGLSHQEAADVLGSPLGTLKTHVLRAKDKLRKQLRDWAPS